MDHTVWVVPIIFVKTMKSMRTLYEERIEKRRRDSHSYSIGSISPESSSRLQIWRDDWAQSDEVFDAKVQSGQ